MTAEPLVIPLAWPSQELSPNARVHWSKRARAVREARRAAYLAMRLAAPKWIKVPHGHLVEIEFVFIPPNRRRFDDDGLAARMKASRDGIADYLGCDDNCFRQSHRVAKVPTPGGEVLVKIRILSGPETSPESMAYAEIDAE